MRLRHISLAILLPLAAQAQSEGVTLLGSGTATATSSGSASGAAIGDFQTANATYVSYASTITLSGSAAATTGSSNDTNSTTSSNDLTELVGGTRTLSGNGTSSTSTAARPTNTQPCNGYVEFCERSYSNITYVAAHNFAFTKPNNAARNQEYGMIDQLNDGVRMLQVQAHYVNNTFYLCHTSCDLLNAGTLQAQLENLVTWLEQNPFEVVTLLIGNYDKGNVDRFVPVVQDSGIEPYLYTPPVIPMGINDWPTTAELILTGKRVVFFMDYMSNPPPNDVNYILEEFSQMWETPYSPTDPNFPCTVDRPPGLDRNSTLNRLYLANHNLNVDFADLGIALLVPNVADINQTNAVSGNSSLGAMANECTAEWTRPPNFLLVDFYNYGSTPGSVFQVAATMNNVTYRGGCCGHGGSSSGATDQLLKSTHVLVAVAVVFLAFLS